MKLIILFILMFAAVGCSDAAIDTTNAAEFAAVIPSENENGPMEQFLVIADGTHHNVLQQVKGHISNFISHAPAGSVLHVVRTPDHKVVGTIVVPQGNERGRLRDKGLMHVLAPINAMLSDAGDVPDAFRNQLSLDRLGATYWSLRQTDQPCRITLIGTPVYYDSRQLHWAFGELSIEKVKRYPSPSTLTHPDSTLPFCRLGRRPIPSDVQIVWLTNSNWGGDKLREDAVIHFYRHAFATQMGGDLVRMTSDAAAAFDPEIISSFPELDEITDPHPPRMIEFMELQVPEQQPDPSMKNGPEPPPKLARLFEQVAADPNQILIAINWTSEYPETDLDLWISDGSGSPELSYLTMKSSFGYLIRDVRHVGDLNGQDLMGKWEVAVLNGVEPSTLSCWLNTYASDGSPVHAKLVVILQGQQTVREFDLACRGDNASGAVRRDTQEAWRQLDIKGNGT